ncbi:TPA: hypothetical protein L5599_001561 [Pseudomonas aeruginosa]|nr:hypothetical protein [Pseudomonas aeruginosa]
MFAPKTITSEIIERLNALSAAGGLFNEMEKARMKRSIEAVKSQDFAKGMMIYGVFYALLGDEKNSLSSHDASLRVAPSNSVYLRNYAVSLKTFGYLAQAFEAYKKVMEVSPGDKGALLKMGELVLCVGQLDSYLHTVERYRKATQDESIMGEFFVEVAQGVKGLIESVGVPEKALSYAYKKVESICKFHEVRPAGCRVSQLDSEGHEYLFLEVKVHCHWELISEMNSELLEAVAEDLDFEFWNKVVHSFVYTPKVEKEFASA